MIFHPAKVNLPEMGGAGPGGYWLAMVQEIPGPAPLPASPPIGGLVWTVVIPAILFLGSLMGTVLLYRKFSREEGE